MEKAHPVNFSNMFIIQLVAVMASSVAIQNMLIIQLVAATPSFLSSHVNNVLYAGVTKGLFIAPSPNKRFLPSYILFITAYMDGTFPHFSPQSSHYILSLQRKTSLMDLVREELGDWNDGEDTVREKGERRHRRSFR
jgi:hypothetical protein